VKNTKTIIIEKEMKFSESLFWQGQRHFYHEKGAKAWASEVPFYITSNPYIADCYAKLILRFIQDWLSQHPKMAQEPFYILELGAGTGQFSFYLLKTLTQLLSYFKLASQPLCYIMSDFTTNNIEFWKQHPQLNPFIENKILDFALFDIENDTAITTLLRQQKIHKETCKNPLIVIGNYLFDSVINDIFYFKNNKIYESLVTLKTPINNIKNNNPKNWKKVSIQHKEKPTTEKHYQHPILDNILDYYAQQLTSGYLLFPIGCLQGLQRLQSLSNNRLLLLSSDKGHTLLQELQHQEFPELDFHGSFSLMVNYHAVAEFFKMSAGSAFLQTPRDGLCSAVFSSGFSLADLPETSYLLEHSIEGFSPTDFFNYYELIESIANTTELKNIASTLCLSCWDPMLFEQTSERISQLLVKEETEIVDYILENLEKIADNFYFVPGCDDIFFSLGYIFYAINHFDKAIHYFEKSRLYFPDSFELLYNLALSYFYKKDYRGAIQTAEIALKIEPHSKEAKSLIRSSKVKLGRFK